MTSYEHLIAGTGAGVLTSFILHPIDLVKVRFQVQDATVNPVKYTGIMPAVRKIWAEEGFRGFYKGVGAACAGSGASWGLYFVFYEATKIRLLAKEQKKREETGAGGLTAAPAIQAAADQQQQRTAPPPAPPAQLSSLQYMYAAWEAGTMTCFLTNPIWLVKTRLQLQTDSNTPAHRRYKGMTNAFTTIVREEGPLALYKGIVPALFLVSHGMVQFAVFEELKRLAKDAPPSAAPLLLLSAGAVSKAIATTVTYPYQVIKSRIQQRMLPLQSQEGVAAAIAAAGGEGAAVAAAPPPAPSPYSGFLSTIKRIAKQEGFRGFYKGFSANLLRVAPQSAVTLFAYEHIKQALAAGGQ